MLIDRRSLIVTGTLGLAGLGLIGRAGAQGLLGATGFTSGVASGEPAATAMLLWTRYVPPGGGEARLRVEVSETADFRRTVAGGETITGPWRDHTAKITATGLKPGARYFYRFVAPDGSLSPVGRTRTLADGMARAKLAVFSCSNIGFGWFGAYAHAAASDCDLAVHLGDYIYEYGPNTYPVAAETVPGRPFAPGHEIVALADYRLRYASYRADADLQALHAAMPMIVIQDDHESANNSWEGGAQNHQATEGDWSLRKAASLQAWREWMPVNEQPWARYDLGDLATIARTDTRLAARSREAAITREMRASPAALAAFRDGAWRDPAATMMGSAQEAWLADVLRTSARGGRRWQVVLVGTNMGFQKTPAAALDLMTAQASEATRAGIAGRVALGAAGLPQDMDNWGGFPAARARFLAAAQAAGGDTIVLSGDSHNAWGYELMHDGRRAAVEFGVQGVTSPGIESALRGSDPAKLAAALIAGNPEMRYADTARRGYMQLSLTPTVAENRWLFWSDVRTRRTAPDGESRVTVTRGTRRITL